MTLWSSVASIAIGAILIWIVSASVAGISLDLIGMILILGGATGLLAGALGAGDPRERRAPRA